MAYKYIKCREEDYEDTLNDYCSQGYILVDLKIVNGSSPREHNLTLLLDNNKSENDNIDSNEQTKPTTLNFDPDTGEVSQEDEETKNLIGQGINEEGEVYAYKDI